jgi:hypothetical protein
LTELTDCDLPRTNWSGFDMCGRSLVCCKFTRAHGRPKDVARTKEYEHAAQPLRY